MSYSSQTTCRCCGSPDLTEVLSLGEQYVSDFVDQNEDLSRRIKVPITLDLCRNCTLVQARHSVPPADLYSYRYWYRSGVTDTMRRQLADVVAAARSETVLHEGDVVLDIGANDGTLLSHYDGMGLVRVAVEPARNLWEQCKQHCEMLVPGFWAVESARDGRSFRLGGTAAAIDRQAKIVTACGMFYDLENPNQFIADVAKILHPQGVFVAQLTCLKQTIKQMDVGNLAHEHLEFYSLQSLVKMFEGHGLRIYKVEENDVNGGSYRLYVKHKDRAKFSESIARALVDEIEMGLSDPVTYKKWYDELVANRSLCREYLSLIVEKHGLIAAVYGASTKGNVIAQWYGLGDFCHVAADRSPEKWGKRMIGSGIDIDSEEKVRAMNPDVFVVLPYAFLSEFEARERDQDWRRSGGKFVVPLPRFRVV